MDPRNPEQQDGQLPPLIAQLPAQATTVPTIIPQNLITAGTRKDCVRLRNLPTIAQVTDILTFLGEYSQFIVYQGVHMVYTAQVGALPAGEIIRQYRVFGGCLHFVNCACHTLQCHTSHLKPSLEMHFILIVLSFAWT